MIHWGHQIQRMGGHEPEECFKTVKYVVEDMKAWTNQIN